MEKYGMKIGITGGIGSGKTTVCRVFSTIGIPVFATDLEANRIMESDPYIIEQVNSIAGRNVYRNGTLKRRDLAEIIFNDSDLLGKINHVVHPAVRKKFEEWQRSKVSDYVILEAAILFESGAYKTVDKVITVVAPFEERVERVIKRNNLSREEIMERIRNQTDDEFKVSRSHYVIDNSDNKLIIPEILRIHEDILKQINERKNNG